LGASFEAAWGVEAGVRVPEGEEVLEDAGVAAGLGVAVGVEAGTGGLQAASRHRLAVRRRAVFFINWMRMMDSAVGKLP
jgi:hypothetical protein